jgi:simple sugar transport system substrate-binding protein
MKQFQSIPRSLTLFTAFTLLATILAACQAPALTQQTPSSPAQPSQAAAASAETTSASADAKTSSAATSEPTTAASGESDAANVTIPEAFADPNNRPRVALVREIGEGSFFERYLAGAQSMADQLGVELVESNARGDQAQMVANIETAIQQQVDAIIVDHGRTDALQPAIERALAAGIKVVTFDLVINNPDVPEIEQDDILIGYLISRQLAVETGGNAEVVYVNVNGFAPLDKRDRAWQDVKWRFAGLTEAAKIGTVSDSTAAETQTQMEAVIRSSPDATTVLAMYNEFAKGAVRAITQAGLADRYRVYSVDITSEDIQLMIEPNSPWRATVGTDSYNVGRLAVRAAAAQITGEEVDKYLLVEPALITQDFLRENNITDMDGLVAALPELGESKLVWYDWMYALVERNGSR